MAREADLHGEAGESPGPGPGELLQSERDRRNLSIAQVAHELHLSVSLVESLERNDFTPLGAPIYIRGHLKNYARLLGQDPGNVLAAYDRIAEWRDPEIDTRQPKGPPVETASRRWVTVVSWLVVAALLVSLTLWGYHRLERLPDSAATGSDPAGERLDGETAGELPAKSDDGPDSAGEMTPGPLGGEGDIPAAASGRDTGVGQPASDDRDASEATEKTVPGTTTREGESPVDSGNPASESGDVDAAGPDGDWQASGEPTAGGEAPADATDAGAEVGDRAGIERDPGDGSESSGAVDGDPPAAGPEVDLTLTVNGESWVEVYDANDQRLIYKLLREGEEHRVSGVAPLRVFLGNAPAIEARAGDRPIDVSSRIRGDKTAYFVIPASPDRTDQQ